MNLENRDTTVETFGTVLAALLLFAWVSPLAGVGAALVGWDIIQKKVKRADDDADFIDARYTPALPASAVEVSPSPIQAYNNFNPVYSPTYTPSPAPIVNVSVKAPKVVNDSFTTGAGAVVPSPTTIAPTVMTPNRDISEIARNTIAKNKGKAESDSLSIIKKYAAMRQNLLVLSVGGGGKGILLSNLFRFRAESDPNFFAYWVDPKSDESESGYFNHTSIVAYRFNGMGCNKDALSNHIQTAMETYKSIRSEMPPRTPNWLCFDEWTSINHRLKNTGTLAEVHDYIASAVSLLDGQNSHLLLVGQSPKLSDIMTEGGGLLSNFSAIILFKQEERSFKMLEKCQQCGTIPKSINADNLYAACNQSPVSRAIYIDGQLLPMPKLANYSSYDRDTGMVLNNDREVNPFDPQAKPATSHKLNPLQIPDCKVAEVMQAIDACSTFSEMSNFFEIDDDASGQPKSIAALGLWKLVKDEGVARAIEVMLPNN